MKPSLVVRLGGLRAVTIFVAVISVGLTLVVSAPLVALWPFGRTHHPTVEIHDEADLFHEDSLVDSLQGLTFRQDVHVAVVSVPGDDIDNLNAKVLSYARTQDTDVPWISQEDSNYWADGLIILAVAPQSRWVGCYFGEDLKPTLEQQEAAQDAARSQLRKADWAGGMVSMGEDLADLIGRPGGNRETGTVLSVLLGLGGVSLIGSYLYCGGAARRRTAAARRSYAQVTHDYETTELAAGTIPGSEPYGAQVLARYRWFRQEYEAVTRLFRDHGEPVGAQWFSWRVLRRATSLRERSAYLDTLDDVVVNATALLTMGHGWEASWLNEQGPVLEDLQSLTSLCDRVDRQGLKVPTTVEREWGRAQKQRLDTMTSELADSRLTPSEALTELDRMADELRVRANALVGTALDADSSRYAADRRRRYQQSQARSSPVAYTGRWMLDSGHGTYSPHSTIRLNPSSPARLVLGLSGGVQGGSAGSASSFVPVSELVVGYSSAASYTPSSSSGDGSGSSSFSGGFGGGGGGFSGAGSSSRF